MPKVRDLTDIINKHPSGSYLSAALSMNWQWQVNERDEAAAKGIKQRQLDREARAQRYGLKIYYIGD